MIPPRFAFALLLASAACTARGGTGNTTPDPADAADAPAMDATPPPMDTPPPPPDMTQPPPDMAQPPPDMAQPPPDMAQPPQDACASSPESSAAACANGRDDDCDGMTDCRDPGCATYCVTDVGPPPDVACVPRGPENTNAACGDRIDNDCDGFIDCGGATGTAPDFDCTMNPAVTVCPRDGGVTPDVACVPRGPENTNAACGDRIDNDCDGYIDCGGATGTAPDFDCTMNPAVTVCPRDGGVTPDVACTPTGPERGAATCRDGVDNDCDGFRDCMDRDCSCAFGCMAFRTGCVCGGAEDTSTTCRDLVDNDCDGFVDCADFDCSLNPAITFCPRDAGRD